MRSALPFPQDKIKGDKEKRKRKKEERKRKEEREKKREGRRKNGLCSGLLANDTQMIEI